MTNEDAIRYIKDSYAIGNDEDSRHHNEVMDYIIQELSIVPERKKGAKYYKADDVIKVLLDNGYGDEENGADPEYMTALHDVYRGLDNISAFTIPEREKGEWIKKGFSSEFHSEIYQCSKCNYELFSLGAPLNFCPNCGTDMGDINDGY